MKRVGVFLEPSWAGEVGGAQTVAAVLAERLSRRYETDLLVVRPDFCLSTLAAASNTVIDGVKLRCIARDRSRRRILGADDYDAFFAIVHDAPPIPPAPVGMLFVLFPFYAKSERWPWRIQDNSRFNLWHKLERMREEYRWNERFSGYQIKTSNSIYTQKWTRILWGIQTDVLYPPIDTTQESTKRLPRILSVGRFSATGVSKGQIELMQEFKLLRQQWSAAEQWSYLNAGALWPNDADRAYYEACQSAAVDTGTLLKSNLSSSELRRAYASSSLFWHWAGFHNDEAVTPQRSEHFGMVTAEAMAHGSVPIVARRGGQPELVQHCVNGFLWDSTEQLRQYSAKLIAEPPLLRQMSLNATQAAWRFSRSQFVTKVEAYLQAHI